MYPNHNMWSQQQAYFRGLSSQHPQQQTLHPGIIDDHAHQHHQYHRDTIIDLPVPSNPRASRNMAEKQRRDNLNTNISTMAALVPIVAGSSRRMDKISILRLAAAFLRTHYTLGCGSTNFLPRQFNEFDLEQYLVDHLIDNGGFFLVVTATGKIVYVSRQVEQHLGHAQNELLGQSMYNFVYPEDHEELSRNLTPEGMHSVTVPSPTGLAQISELVSDNNSSSSEDSTNCKTERRKFFREERRSFRIRMSQRTISKRENTQYEYLHISGILRLAEACRNADTNRRRHREMASTSNDVVFAGIVSLPKKRPITELSIIDANKDEYVTRHLVDGRIIYCDHRVSVVAGYLSEEVSGLSAFAFMHRDDYRWTIIGLRQMYDRAETCGSSCYRLLSKTGEFIYLRTHGYLEYDKETQTVESFVCINTLISEEEGIDLIKDMRERFSAIVSGTTKAIIKSTDNSEIKLGSEQSSSKCSMEDPSQLEDAITHLISDLPSPAVSEDRFSPSPMPNTQYMKAAIFSQRLPPAAAQANKIGINKIDHYLVLYGKGNRTPKQEFNTDKHIGGKLVSSNGVEHTRTPDPEDSKPTGKPLSIHKMINTVRDKTRNEDIFVVRESNMDPCISSNHVSRLDVPQNAKMLNMQERNKQSNTNMNSPNTLPEYNIKVEQDIDMFDHMEKQETMLQYFDGTASNSTVVSPETRPRNRGSLKRICSNEDLRTTRSKRKPNGVYTSTHVNNGPQSISEYMNCKTFMVENEYPTLSSEFNQYNDATSQSAATAESPNSSLHEVGVDYQQLVEQAAPLIITNPDEEQFADLQDLKDDTLLSPGLDANPELMMKIFDDLRPVMDFEKGFNNTKIQRLIPNEQTVNDEIRRTHQQLADSMALRESQFNVLARDLENPALRVQRENLSQLQAEHKMQKQMLKTLQQDHHNMQMNVK